MAKKIYSVSVNPTRFGICSGFVKLHQIYHSNQNENKTDPEGTRRWGDKAVVVL